MGIDESTEIIGGDEVICTCMYDALAVIIFIIECAIGVR